MNELNMNDVSSELNKYYCDVCDYRCCKQSEWNRHISRKKHKNEVKGNSFCSFINANTNTNTNTNNQKAFECECGNQYKHRQSLQNHKKKCMQNQTGENVINNELIIELIQANKDLKQLLVDQNNKIMEIVKDGKQVTNNTNTFNLNFFLNEQCKNAINIMDFISSLPLHLNDLEDTARLGYVDGISKIIIKGMQQLDIYKRPIHCSDLKRETLYIRDKNIWEKEDKEKTRLKNAIKYVGSKNIQQIPLWVEKNPTCTDTTSKKNDEYMSLIVNTMIGSSIEEQNDNVNKIISKVVKEIVIEK
jgi:hypothetical protein